jgi:uncharacterized phage protein (TIGR02216 family)
MAAGFGLLRLAPSALWSMTPREFAAAMSAILPPPREPPAASDLAQLMRDFPDARPAHPSR